jgi:hypothetical protein
VAAEGDQPQGEGEFREGRRPRRERNRDRDRDWQPRGERDPMAVIEPEASPLPTASEAPASEGSPLLRGQDGAVSEAPAFLGRKTRSAPAEEAPAPAAAEGGEEVKKPRRRRAPRSFEAGEGAPAPSESEEA